MRTKMALSSTNRAALGILMTALALASGAYAAGKGAALSRNKGLEGTWRVEVTLFDCESGIERPSFWSLLTFARGGTLTETTANQALPGERTPGHGVWGGTGRDTYLAASEAFLLFGPALRPWTQRITQNIVMLSDDEFESQASVAFSLTPGSLPPAPVPLPPSAGCARAVGYRF